MILTNGYNANGQLTARWTAQKGLTNLQRWLNQDPLGEDGGLNLYQFTSNNPANRVDVFGLQGVPALDSQSANPVLATELAREEQGLSGTCNLASKLARNLARAGRAVPKAERAHHIIAQNAKKAEQARKVLKKFKIDVDDAANRSACPRSFMKRSTVEGNMTKSMRPPKRGKPGSRLSKG